MGLWRERPQGHGCSVETGDDRLHRLHLVQADRSLRGTQFHHVTEGKHRPLIDQPGKLPVVLIVAALHRLAQRPHHVGIVGVVLPAMNIFQQSTLFDLVAKIPGTFHQGALILLQILETATLQPVGGATETELHHLIVQPYRFKQLGTPVAGDGGDPHLGDDLVEPLVDPLAIVVHQLATAHTTDLTGALQIEQTFIGEIGEYRGSTVANQHRKLVRIAGGGGLHHDIGIAAQPLLDQLVVYRTGSQQGVDRHPIRSDLPIRQNQHHLAPFYRGQRLIADTLQRLLQVTVSGIVEVDTPASVVRIIQLLQLLELAHRQHRRIHQQPGGVILSLLEQIFLPPETALQRHHYLLPDRVDGGVGHLRKLLTEVVIERAHPARQHCRWRIIPHGTDRLLARFGQHPQHLITLFETDLEQFLIDIKALFLHRPGALLLTLQLGFQPPGVPAKPLLVGLAILELLLDLLRQQQLSSGGIDGQHLTGTEPPLGHHLLREVVVHTDLGRQGDMAIVGNHPAGRAQAVAIQHTAGIAAIGQDNPRRAIPRLHVHGVVFVEGTQIRIQRLHVLPGRRNQQTHSAEHIHTAGQQRLQHVVQTAGVGTGHGNQRAHIRHGNMGRLEFMAAGHRPVAVALNGVDLAVMGQVTERLRQPPLRPGVGGETLMEHTQRRLQPLIIQIPIEHRQVGGHHQAFVRHHPG